MAQDTLTITDNRTNRTYTLPIENGTIRAMDLRQMKTGPEDFGLMTYDPAFMNTAACRSSITFIDGERGILEYRGYPIEVLAEHCTFLEVAYLLLFGELPDEPELKSWTNEITHHSMLQEATKKFMEGFRYDAHPMAMLVSTVAALSAVYPGAKEVHDPANRLLQIKRLIGKMPSIAAMSYRHNVGFPYVYPDNDLSYTENFMNMLWKMVEPKYVANPVLARALDILFILHADHEQNCSTSAMRSVGSSYADPYLATAAAAAALSGSLHGGANEQVLKMLDEIGSKENVPAYLKKVREGHVKLMGFGHRVYKNYDPRAKIIKWAAEQVFEVTGRNPKLDIGLELERIALEDDYFVSRKLYPNVDFYSGIIYQAMGFKPEMFTALFAIPRTVGWLAQWQEMIVDPEQKISRPRQIYTGQRARRFLPMEERQAADVAKMDR
ncbi:MAG TPA: citrate synthase [Acidobacteriaceae bacterium]|nr:citrate synthase [Terriglobia bacterium]HVC89562.1 citrate synthase [Acidobacteriaceae bacterium]